LKLLVRVGSGVEVDADDPRVPAPLASVGARHLLDEPVLRKRAQVIAARRGAFSDLVGAFGRG
jgi:hypothetical protein